LLCAHSSCHARLCAVAALMRPSTALFCIEQSRALEDVLRRIDAEAAAVNPFGSDAERLREALTAGAARLGALCEEKSRVAAEVDRLQSIALHLFSWTLDRSGTFHADKATEW
jgi:hypothetical protein